MTLNISVSQFRNNVADYLGKVAQGTRVFIRDDKRDITLAQIIRTSSFDKYVYEDILQKVSGIMSAVNHPEWKTQTQVKHWLMKSRLSDDRKF